SPMMFSSTASSRRSTHIGKMTSGYLPRLNRSRRTSSAMPQMKETILLWVAWSIAYREKSFLSRAPPSHLRDDVAHYVTIHVGRAKIPASVTGSQLFVVESEQVEDRLRSRSSEPAVNELSTGA